MTKPSAQSTANGSRRQYGQIDVSADLHRRLKLTVLYGRLREAATAAAFAYLAANEDAVVIAPSARS
jgi:hypothetical protein